MSGALRSFEKFSYLLRPSKQVERKLFIEAVHHLAEAGLAISRYAYVGFGSVYFADFTLFHKHLYIDEMTCVEREAIERRMRFNSPFGFVKVVMKPVSEVIPKLSPTKKYIVWLDYDVFLVPDVLDDIDKLVQRLAPGSIFMITVDARAQLPRDDDSQELTPSEREEQTLAFYKDHFERYVSGTIQSEDLVSRRVPELLAQIIRAKIGEAMLGRSPLSFLQLFNWLYKDNAPMLTVGGLIAKKDDARLIWKKVSNVEFLTKKQKPVVITVPPLTQRERHWLDANRVGKGGKRRRVPFELEDAFVHAYVKYARYYPSYFEALV